MLPAAKLDDSVNAIHRKVPGSILGLTSTEKGLIQNVSTARLDLRLQVDRFLSVFQFI